MYLTHIQTSLGFMLKKLTQERVSLDPMEEAMLGNNWWKAVGSPSPVMIDLISNVVSGLEYLHKLNIIHRNLSPSNVIIIYNLKTFVAKLSGMRISKRLPLDKDNLFLDHHATCFDDPGWEAPEQIRKGKETFATDMFRLGCVIFFALTGVHPFGCVEDRSNNIKKNFRPNFKRVTHPEASHLIHSLLNPNWRLRPTATNVLLHPFFWISDKRLNFLRAASDMIEANSKLWDKLRDREKDVEGCKEWNKKLDNDLVIHIQRKDEYGVPVHREYNFKSLRHLLRLIRNEISHHLELPENIKGLIGTFPEGYDSYFTTRFPKLFIVVYQFVSKHFMEENALKVYLK